MCYLSHAILVPLLCDSLKIEKFRFTGSILSNLQSEYDRLLGDFFTNKEVLSKLEVASSNPSIHMDLLSTSVMSMDFFDRLDEYVAPNGNIRGCFEETYDGIVCQDLLRELLLNIDSENSSLYSSNDRNQYIYHLFKLICIGGSLCQPDNRTDRYLSMIKSLYKETLTVYKDGKSNSMQISGRVYSITSPINDNSVFKHPDSTHNSLLLIVDTMKKVITTIKLDYKSFW